MKISIPVPISILLAHGMLAIFVVLFGISEWFVVGLVGTLAAVVALTLIPLPESTMQKVSDARVIQANDGLYNINRIKCRRTDISLCWATAAAHLVMFVAYSAIPGFTYAALTYIIASPVIFAVNFKANVVINDRIRSQLNGESQ